MSQLQRQSGILLHPTSLPSPYGIGDLGEEAYRFVDFLANAGQHLWQTLPLTHTGYGDSPYQSFSAFAGQPLLISPDYLVSQELLDREDLSGCPVCEPDSVNYGAVIPWKEQIFRLAYRRFLVLDATHRLKEDYEEFCRKYSFWLQDYGLFMACKELNQGKSWLDWEDSYRTPSAETKAQLKSNLTAEMGYYQFLQFLFFREWKELKQYANAHGIRIIGDIPIFVSMDSADVWSHPELFQLDEKGYPSAVAGVPPDYFSATGQLWGNPLYRWEAHEKEQFAWWISRIRSQLENLDILRIDHFRGFEAYWSVPYGEETAVNGTWLKAPGRELFQAISRELGELPIIAEDLGVITPEVDALREAFHFPGMKVLQFAFDSTGESAYLPHCFTNPQCVCYTGTHDNDTTLGWFAGLGEDCRAKVLSYTQVMQPADIGWGLIRESIASIAAYAIFPLQDVLRLHSGRMNTPGVAAGNWSWRFQKDALTSETAEALKKLTLLYGRN